jgi:hypothetical protein
MYAYLSYLHCAYFMHLSGANTDVALVLSCDTQPSLVVTSSKVVRYIIQVLKKEEKTC